MTKKRRISRNLILISLPLFIICLTWLIITLCNVNQMVMIEHTVINGNHFEVSYTPDGGTSLIIFLNLVFSSIASSISAVFLIISIILFVSFGYYEKKRMEVLKEKLMFCPFCGSPLSNNNRSCPNCKRDLV